MSHPLLAFGIPTGADMFDIVVLVLVLVLFGAKKLPHFGRSFHRSMTEFLRGRDHWLQQPGDSADDVKKSLGFDSPESFNRAIVFVFGFAILLLILSFSHKS